MLSKGHKSVEIHIYSNNKYSLREKKDFKHWSYMKLGICHIPKEKRTKNEHVIFCSYSIKYGKEGLNK